jgi:hypothetical protein
MDMRKHIILWGILVLVGGCTGVSETPSNSQPVVDSIQLSNFSGQKLVVLNKSGLTYGSPKSIGTVPKMLLPKTIQKASATTSLPKIYKDLPRTDQLERQALQALKTRAVRGIKAYETVTPATNSHDFWVIKDIEHQSVFTSVSATKVFGDENSACLIFVEDNTQGDYSSVDWAAIGATFNNTIHPRVTQVFGNPTDIDANQKVIILYFEMNNNMTNYCGFFNARDLYSAQDLLYSNEMEMFYLNLGFLGVNGGPEHPEMIRTLAHEFQHMINYSSRVISKNISAMDIWMDEGLAESSEAVALNTPGTSRIIYMNADTNNYIRNGFPLCVWESEIENYCLSYTFMQYFRIQSGLGDTAYQQLINHSNPDYRAIVAVLGAANAFFENFETILTGYRLANLAKQTTGYYGYKDEASTFDLQVYPPTTSDIELKPGGCVYLDVTKEDLTEFSPDADISTDLVYLKVLGDN